MSRLEAIVRSLCEVVLSYCEIQTGRKEPIEQYLNQPHSEFMARFQSIVKEASIHAKSRSSLLDYLMSEIQFLKPLVEQPSLSEDDALKVHQRLFYLIDNVNHLLQMPQTSSLSATPAPSEHYKLFGLLRGIFKRQSNLSNFGDLLKYKFFDPLCIDLYKTSSPMLKDFMKKLLEEHQNQLSQSSHSNHSQEKLDTLQAANDAFLTEIESLKTSHKALEERNNALQENVKQLQDQLEEALKVSQTPEPVSSSLIFDTGSLGTEQVSTSNLVPRNESSENKHLEETGQKEIKREDGQKEESKRSLLVKFGMIYGQPLSAMLSAMADNNDNSSKSKDSPNIQPRTS